MFRILVTIAICLCFAGNLLIPAGWAGADAITSQAADCQRCACDDRCCVSSSETPSLPPVPIAFSGGELSKFQIIRAARLLETCELSDETQHRMPFLENAVVGYAGVPVFLFCRSLLI